MRSIILEDLNELKKRDDLIIRYLDLNSRRLNILINKMGINWEPKYAEELNEIDAELAYLLPAVETLRKHKKNGSDALTSRA